MTEPPPPPTPASQPGKWSAKKVKIALAAYAVVLLVSVFLIFRPDSREGDLEAFAEKCGNGTYQLGDNGNSISFSLKPSDEEDGKFVNCVLTEAGIPDKVRFRITNTGPFDGAQHADWDGWELYWSSDLKAVEAKILLSKA
jgi:hypothetical protein